MSEEKLDVRKAVGAYLGIVYRALGYWKLGLVVCILVTAGGTVYAATRRKVWTSHTRIRVVSAGVSGMMEADAMDQMHQDLESRLKQYTQSRRFLQEIIDEYGLYQEIKTRKNMTDEEVLDHMRGKLYWGVYEGDEFGFHFTDYDPDLAQAVCKSLADNFIQQRQTADYSVFRTKVGRVEKQLEEVEERLERAEERLTRFKEVNAELIAQMRREQILGGGSPSGEVDEGPTGPSSETQVTRNDSPQLRRLRIRLRAMEENASRLRTKQAASTGTRDSALGDQRARVTRELQDAQQRYARLRAQWTEEFPDVRAAKARVVELERRKREIDARFREFQATSRQPSAELASLNREIERTREEIRRMARREAAERRANPTPEKAPEGETKAPSAATAPDVDDIYSRRLKTVPEVATILKRLETEITPLRDQYQKLTSQKLELEFQAQQRAEGGLQYHVIDPANRPSKPSGPHRAKIAAISGVAGGFLGLAVMALLGFVDNRLYRAADMDRIDQIPLLVTVPDYEDIVSEIAAIHEETSQATYDRAGHPPG